MGAFDGYKMQQLNLAEYSVRILGLEGRIAATGKAVKQRLAGFPWDGMSRWRWMRGSGQTGWIANAAVRRATAAAGVAGDGHR